VVVELSGAMGQVGKRVSDRPGRHKVRQECDAAGTDRDRAFNGTVDNELNRLPTVHPRTIDVDELRRVGTSGPN